MQSFGYHLFPFNKPEDNERRPTQRFPTPQALGNNHKKVMTKIAEELFDEAKARLRRIEAAHGIRILYACEAGSRSWGFPSPTSDYDIRFIYVSPLKSLRRIEAAHGIRILYACEAGSRSWGFPSPTSDYDIRFIYVSPLKSYLRLTPMPDTITLPQDELWDIQGWDLRKCLHLLKKGNVSVIQWLYSPIIYLTPMPDTITLPQDELWDIQGWDLRKCLHLLKKGNVSVIQWLYSPIIYRNHPLFLTELRKLLDYGSPLPRLYWAYRSMAQSHISNYLMGNETIAYKRFLYIVQGLLAMNWVAERRTMPPVVFEQLVEGMVADENLRTEIETLLNIQRRDGHDGEVGPKQLFPAVLAFIENTLVETQPPMDDKTEIPSDVLDEFFIKWLGVPGL